MSANDLQIGGTHYRDMKVQPWEFMEAVVPPEQFIGHLRCTVIAYLARAGAKGDALEDYQKARHTLDKLIETMIETECGSKGSNSCK